MALTDHSDQPQYGTFPDGQGKDWTIDGIVMGQRYIRATGGTVLIHELGHWLGLRHTFVTIVDTVGQDCKGDDGMPDTRRTPGFIDTLHECNQIPCDKKSRAEGRTVFVTNYMSVCSAFFLVQLFP